MGSALISYLIKNTHHSIFGLTRRKSQIDLTPIQNFIDNPRFKVIYGDISDDISINDIVKQVQPDYFINYAGYTSVQPAWESPVKVFDTNVLGVMRCLESIVKNKLNCRFLQSGSILQFENSARPINEDSKPAPANIYGGSKNAAHDLIKIYREKYNLFAVNAILGNNESSQRGVNFLTNKVTKGIVNILKNYKEGKPISPIKLGNLDAIRSWGDTDDFVEACWLMLNHGKPVDYLISTDEPATVRDFVEYACFCAGLALEWRGLGLNEFAFIPPFEKDKIIEVSVEFFRAEKDYLRADASKIKKELGWSPKTDFRGLVKKLINSELNK